mmetsp:Transcript_9795/g.19110  ORF Transcript_9795/g.19110 Transcript_9795/m.19110 type:complete len:201 (-) Transcript_9795:98-700(-)
MLRSSAQARMLAILSSTSGQKVPFSSVARHSMSIARWNRSGTFSSAAPIATTLPVLLARVGKQWRAHSHGHSHGHSHDHDGPSVKIKFVYQKNGKEFEVDAPVGMNVLRVAQAHEIELEGACECSLACSTCHVVLEGHLFDTLEEPTDDENDMLDLAFGLTETSRLGCQIIVTEEMNGAVFKIPSATRNMYVDGHVPKPH